MSEKKEDVRIKFRATLEGKKLSRLSEDVAYEKLKELEKEIKILSAGKQKDRKTIIYSVLREELEKKIEVYNNMQFGGVIEGGSYGGGGGSGNDAG
ncbi:MAG: hypothetical protein CBD97_02140 [Pelagibacteraceae bacterium TMED237]|nr:MAG: hypothetical protein CBD97_02140 [Pelagibacteraceae bacterium TMED237]|tara:strand:- start:3363 stop:3650 length:288 start_codon:yes stop_codon:yes gene_type:complete